MDIDIDLQGWRPIKGQIDNDGKEIQDRIYNVKDFDRTMVIDDRTMLVAKTVSNFLKRTHSMAKTIIFCNDIDHADRMRRALVNLNPDEVTKNEKYVMKITGDDEIGKAQLDHFINPKKSYPVIVTTSELMTTGVDAKTCKLVVLDFRKATELFADERFDGIPEKVMETDPETIGNEDDPTFEEEFYGDDGEEQEGKETGDEVGGEFGDDGTGVIGEDSPKYVKYHVSGVTVKKIAERVQYYDADGKLVTESFKDYTRKTIKKQFASLNEFIKRWRESEKKTATIEELANEGVFWEALEEEVGKEMDPFDLICHVVFDQPPLSRKERANNVKKRNYFTKYSDTAQTVLNGLLDKYADAGVQEIEKIHILKVKPFDEMGQPMEIARKAFGGKQGYDDALKELESELYSQKMAKSRCHSGLRSGIQYCT